MSTRWKTKIHCEGSVHPAIWQLAANCWTLVMVGSLRHFQQPQIGGLDCLREKAVGVRVTRNQSTRDESPQNDDVCARTAYRKQSRWWLFLIPPPLLRTKVWSQLAEYIEENAEYFEEGAEYLEEGATIIKIRTFNEGYFDNFTLVTLAFSTLWILLFFTLEEGSLENPNNYKKWT